MRSNSNKYRIIPKNCIRETRVQFGISVPALARYLDVPRATLEHWEVGYTDVPTERAIAIADFFGVTLDYLYYRDEELAINKDAMKAVQDDSFKRGQRKKEQKK